MNATTRWAVTLAIAMVAAPAANAQTTYYVDMTCGDDTWSGTSLLCEAPDGPKASIQAGIDATLTGDTVIVADGTYRGPGNRDIDFGGRLITVRSANGPEACIIDCQQFRRGFYLHSLETHDAVLDGFTIMNGSLVYGGGIYCSTSSPTIANCRIVNNHASSRGGGIDCYSDSSPMIVNCLIAGNSADRGGGVECLNSSHATFVNCTIVDNTATTAGGLSVFGGSNPTLQNCIVWNNTPPGILVGSGSPVVTYSDIGGGWPSGEGCIDADPLFVSGPASFGDYYLSQTAAGQPDQSVCVDAGDPASPLIEGTTRTDELADGGIVDLGYHYPIPGEPPLPGDIDRDGDVDIDDFVLFAKCLAGPHVRSGRDCVDADLDEDGDTDLEDCGGFQLWYTGT